MSNTKQHIEITTTQEMEPVCSITLLLKDRITQIVYIPSITNPLAVSKRFLTSNRFVLYVKTNLMEAMEHARFVLDLNKEHIVEISVKQEVDLFIPTENN